MMNEAQNFSIIIYMCARQNDTIEGMRTKRDGQSKKTGKLDEHKTSEMKDRKLQQTKKIQFTSASMMLPHIFVYELIDRICTRPLTITQMNFRKLFCVCVSDNSHVKQRKQ